MKIILEIQNLTTEFHTEEAVIRAVDDVSFSVSKGETVGVVGESGSGKSVTSLSVMRLISKPGKISSGAIYFHENTSATNLLSIPESQIRKFRGSRMAMIFQEPMT